MDCKEVLENMSDCVDCEASESERAALMEHLGSCAQCRKEYESALASANLVKNLPRKKLSAEQRAALREALDRARKWRVYGLRRFSFSRGMALGAVAAACVILAVYALFLRQKPRPAVQEQNAQIAATKPTAKSVVITAHNAKEAKQQMAKTIHDVYGQNGVPVEGQKGEMNIKVGADNYAEMVDRLNELNLMNKEEFQQRGGRPVRAVNGYDPRRPMKIEFRTDGGQ